MVFQVLEDVYCPGSRTGVGQILLTLFKPQAVDALRWLVKALRSIRAATLTINR